VPKTQRGPGSVAPENRDPQRLFDRDTVAEGLEEPGGQCLQYGDPLSLEDAKGHHVDRHADGGGATDPDNLAVLCGPCHTEVHRP
jgi:5-methylcytosine-specific restriction endonuclease McrA